MSRLLLLSLAAIVAVMTVVPAARGELPQWSVGRYLGIGWSDGYHSHTACPPKPHILHHRAAPIAMPAPPSASAPLPWWKIPASSTESAPGESLPTPASPAVGPSLFRQPGEGSSVTDSTGPKL